MPRSLTLAYTEMATHIAKKAPEGGLLAELISGFTRWASEAERQQGMVGTGHTEGLILCPRVAAGHI